MALIKCPECGKEQSSFGKVCSYCSFPLEEYVLNPDDFSWESKKEEELIQETVDISIDADDSKTQESGIIQETIPEGEIKENCFDEGNYVDLFDSKDFTYNGPIYDFTDGKLVDNNYVDSATNDKGPKLFINMGLFHKIIDWSFAVIIILLALLLLAGGVPIVGVIWLLVGVGVLPIDVVLSLWDKIFNGKNTWLRTIIMVLLIFISIIFV